MSANGRAILRPSPHNRSRFEEAVRSLLRGALLGERRLQPFDFAREQRDTLGQILDRQQRQILTDLVADFPAWAVVFLEWHISPRSLIAAGGPSRRGRAR